METQSTKYLYTSTVNASWATSEIYPDSGDTDENGTDQVKFTFDRLGRKASMTDQRGVVHEYAYYNTTGQFEADKITTLPGGVDGTVRRIQRTYDNSGRVTHITSYDSATGGNVVNEIRNTYADGGANGSKWGRLTMSEQAHTGGVGGGTPPVEYAYADGAVRRSARARTPVLRCAPARSRTAGCRNLHAPLTSKHKHRGQGEQGALASASPAA